MAIYRPTYATRRDVTSATDIAQTSDYFAHVDSALMKAADDVDSLCKRRFYNVLETHYWDWPNYQRAYPWRIWFEQNELADVTVNVPVVTSGGTSIPSSVILWGPWMGSAAPPYRFLEINRSTSYGFGVGQTPQQDVAITGLFGYWLKTRAAGTFAAAVSSTSATSVTVSDSSPTGLNPGDVLTVGTESMLVQDNALVSTGIALDGDGGTSDASNDNVLTLSATGLVVGEVITIDSESMLVTLVNGDTATVIRSYDGTSLETHSDNATVYACRQLTVERGFGGTTAATADEGATLTADIHPGQVKELALAEALNTVYQKTSAYARTVGEVPQATTVPGGSLPNLRQQVLEGYGRKLRIGVI
jgi:hypothetical protein